MALTTVNPGLLDSLAQYTGFKNRIINGAMMIDQRNAGASMSVPTATAYTIDRWRVDAPQTGKLTAQQNLNAITPPAGYTNYLGVSSTSAYSIVASDSFYINQRIESNNVSDLSYGTANASVITFSFWVRSSLTGTFGGSLFNGTGNKTYPFAYTILAANTWEQKTITIAGDTTTAIGTGTGIGLMVSFGLGVGSSFSGTAGSWQTGLFTSATGATSVVGTSGATFYITGVQLEKGSTATSFDYRPYGTELALCQRYFEFGGAYTQAATSGGGVVGSTIQYKVTKRASPTVSLTAINGSSATTVTNFSASGLVNGIGYYCVPNGNGQATVDWTASAEL